MPLFHKLLTRVQEWMIITYNKHTVKFFNDYITFESRPSDFSLASFYTCTISIQTLDTIFNHNWRTLFKGSTLWPNLKLKSSLALARNVNCSQFWPLRLSIIIKLYKKFYPISNPKITGKDNNKNENSITNVISRWKE